MPETNVVGQVIQQVREEQHKSQEVISGLAGIGRTHLSAIERGVSGASLEVLEKLCLLLSVSADYLIFGQSHADDEALMLARQISNIDPKRKESVKKAICALLELSTM